MNTSPSADGPEPIPFSRWLREHGAGHLDDRLTATMREVIDAVVLHQKSGTVTLALDIIAGCVALAGLYVGIAFLMGM